MVATVKFCKDCNFTKPLSDFYKTETGVKGVSTRCKPCHNTKSKKYNKEHPDQRLETGRRFYANHPERCHETSRRWSAENKNWKAAYIRRQREENPQLLIRTSVGNMVRYGLRKRAAGKGGKSVFSVLPYSLEELMAHLEGLFQPGMTWKNYGEWHIDHIKPNCSFSYSSTDDPEFTECWKLSNLQPLWKNENLSKGGHFNTV